MATKPGKAGKRDRQAVIDELRRQQKGADRRRGYAIVGVCTTVAVLIVVAAAYGPVRNWYDLRSFKSASLASIGAPASSCGSLVSKQADGNQQHVEQGQSVDYKDAPPAFGAHWNVAGVAPAPMNRKFYTAKDRPALEALVHNLEHGYTILWYDQTAAKDDTTMNQVEAIADKFHADPDNFRSKFIAAPWLAGDESGKAFPKGAHIAIDHWSAGGSGQTDTTKQRGEWLYCSQPSGAALEKFMLRFPYTDSPEPASM